MLAAGYAAYLGVPMIGPDGAVQGILAVYDARPRDWREEEAEALHALAATLPRRARTPSSTRGSATSSSGARRSSRTSPTGSSPSTARARSCSGTPPPSGSPASRRPRRSAGRRREALGRSLEAGGGRSGGSRLVPIRRGGEEVWLSLSEAVMTDPAGAVAGRIFAFRDISAERGVEQMKSDFVSTVSHELRTPLTSIYGFAETLLRQDVLFGEEERETFLRYIASESERLTAIVDRAALGRPARHGRDGGPARGDRRRPQS